jgi:DNA-directed RNA polymerase specialized sigma24 family protein
VEGERQIELIGAALAGDTAAFAELAESHRARLRLLALRVVDDSEEAEDVVQEALLHAYLGLTQLRDPERFGGWLGAIVLNIARMTLRRRGAYQRALARAGAEGRRGPMTSTPSTACGSRSRCCRRRSARSWRSTT